MQRSVVGPPGMSDEAAKYYRRVFADVYDSPEWQDYMKTKSLLGKFITGNELLSYWTNELANHEKLLTQIGEIKK
jgi:tripartite-type tricarboxylate transporter receptor subunit TctC